MFKKNIPPEGLIFYCLVRMVALGYFCNSECLILQMEINYNLHNQN